MGCRLLCLPRILYTLCFETFGHILVDVRCFVLVLGLMCRCFLETLMHVCEDGKCGCRLDKLVLLLSALYSRSILSSSSPDVCAALT